MQDGAREEFQLSGQVDPALFPVASFGTVILCAALGAVYGVLDAFNPSVKLAFLVTILAGAATGALVAKLLRACRVRSMPIALGLTLAGQAVGYYLSWCTWIYSIRDRFGMDDVTFADLAKSPGPLWQLINAINDVGAWTIGSSTHGGDAVSGMALWLVWIAEAGILIGTPLYVVRKMMRSDLFCEQCNRWCPKVAGVSQLAAGSKVKLRQSLLSGDLAYLEGLGLARAGAAGFTEIDHHFCKTCEETHAVTVKLVALTAQKGGGLKRAETVLIDKLLVTAEDAAWMRELSKRLRAAQKAEADAKKAEAQAQKAAAPDGGDGAPAPAKPAGKTPAKPVARAPAKARAKKDDDES